MNPITVVFTLIGGLFLAFSLRIISLTVFGDYFYSHPWWIYFIVIGIGVSATMSAKCWIEEKKHGKSPQCYLTLGAKIPHEN
ncbi:sporulation YhaL family protein [Salipaludibacillus sp. HK11]|uniref:sporulation YhaL family protein n=1 Tax=Salipaludibacillus sp. HK11 TaxID=3394320 RepID=UPI0039FCDDC5